MDDNNQKRTFSLTDSGRFSSSRTIIDDKIPNRIHSTVMYEKTDKVEDPPRRGRPRKVQKVHATQIDVDIEHGNGNVTDEENNENINENNNKNENENENENKNEKNNEKSIKNDKTRIEESAWKKNMPFIAQSFLQYFGSDEVKSRPDPKATSLPVQKECTCGNIHSRDVYVYFLTEAASFSVDFCGCTADAATLMSLGLMPISPETPRTAILLGLMDFMMEMRDSCAAPGQSISKLYNNWHRLNQQRAMADAIPQNIIPRYLELLELVDAIVETNAKGYKLNHFNCPACELEAFVPIDGNFSLKGEKEVIRVEEMTQALSSLWIDNKVVEKYANEKGEKKTDIENSFKAGNNLTNTRKKYPVNGVFGAICARHEIALKMADLTTVGESFKYPLAVISQLLADDLYDGQTAENSPKMYIMYDIMCKLEKSLQNNFPGLMEKAELAVPVFHAYAHIQHCQVQRNPRLRDDFGLTNGEGIERLWSYLNKYVSMTRKMTLYNRHLALYRAVLVRNKEKKMQLGAVLRSRHEAAEEIQSDVEEKLIKMSEELIRKSEKEWTSHVELVRASKSFANISGLLPTALDEETQYFQLLAKELNIIGNMSELNEAESDNDSSSGDGSGYEANIGDINNYGESSSTIINFGSNARIRVNKRKRSQLENKEEEETQMIIWNAWREVLNRITNDKKLNKFNLHNLNIIQLGKIATSITTKTYYPQDLVQESEEKDDNAVGDYFNKNEPFFKTAFRIMNTSTKEHLDKFLVDKTVNVHQKKIPFVTLIFDVLKIMNNPKLNKIKKTEVSYNYHVIWPLLEAVCKAIPNVIFEVGETRLESIKQELSHHHKTKNEFYNADGVFIAEFGAKSLDLALLETAGCFSDNPDIQKETQDYVKAGYGLVAMLLFISSY